MSLSSTIKNIVIGLSLVVSLGSFAQEEEKDVTTESTESKSTIFSSTKRQKLFALSLGYQHPIATGDNFIGSALNGKSGYDLKLKMFVYKQFFIEYTTTYSRFKVKKSELVGNYKNSNISANFLNIGYEFLPLPDFRVGVNLSFFGKSSINNSGFTNSNDEFQRDTGNLSSYGGYIAYDIHSNVSIYVDYSYRIIKTNINTARSLENFFSQGTYQTFGLGLILTVGNKDAISTVIDY